MAVAVARGNFAMVSGMNEIKCTQCGVTGLEPGFIEDRGQGAQGFSQWISGPLEVGFLGGARRMGRQRWAVHAVRCPRCMHLELFAGHAS